MSVFFFNLSHFDVALGTVTSSVSMKTSVEALCDGPIPPPIEHKHKPRKIQTLGCIDL